MNVPHSARPKPSWFGESVGHYEGDALVVDDTTPMKELLPPLRRAARPSNSEAG